jgi:hypothetical protein
VTANPGPRSHDTEPGSAEFGTKAGEYWARIGHGTSLINFGRTRLEAFEVRADKALWYSRADDHEILMTSPAVLVIGCSNNFRTLKGELTRSDDLERVTRIELAWPAWKVAVTVRTCAISEGGVCSADTVNDRTWP